MRTDERRADALRKVKIHRHYLKDAEGSVLIEMGLTKVICSATLEDGVPAFLRNSSRGWVTAEYGMLPRSAERRIPREVTQGRVGGRTSEIQRLIGRSLRAVSDLTALDGKTVWIDCDVIQADGGTRTAAITGAYVAFVDAAIQLRKMGVISRMPVTDQVAAVSVGIVAGEVALDLDYSEDVSADVDMNIVMTGSGQFIEIQGTAEKSPFSNAQMNQMLKLASRGIKKLLQAQNRALGEDMRWLNES